MEDTAARELVEKRERERNDMAKALRTPTPLRALFARSEASPHPAVSRAIR